MKIKRLNLDYWMETEYLLKDCIEHSPAGYTKVDPSINKQGIYCDGEKSWFELVDGRAFSYPVGDFKYSLALLHASELRNEEIEGLHAVCRTKFATKSQRHLDKMHRDWCSIRAVGRSSRKSMISWRKKL